MCGGHQEENVSKAVNPNVLVKSYNSHGTKWSESNGEEMKD